MHPDGGFADRIGQDFRAARQRFELYERFYRSLSGRAREYLRAESARYKRSLLEIQQLILPAVEKLCPACETQCCKLYTPELSIYIAGTVGCFGLGDYLLVRCDAVLPDPCYPNAEKHLCPFWKDGCILPPDCRSFLCIQFFCERLKQNLDMASVGASLGRTKAILDSFSIGRCMA